MNGYPLPPERKEMKAMKAYMHWLSQGIPVGHASKMPGRRLAKIDRKMVKAKAADPVKGKAVYVMHCAACHGINGEGIKKEGKAKGYIYPALWGTDDTYNKGAGMYRILKAADFIKSNMPLGATYENPILTDEEAYNVAAYMNDDSHYRPAQEVKEHKFGPFGDLIK